MNRKIAWLLVIVVAVLVAGVALSKPGDALHALKFWDNKVTYVADLSDEITLLETELASLDAQIERGELSEEQAIEARERITNRIEKINATVTSAEKAALSPEARQRLNDSLSRLSNALVTYRDSLVITDAVAEGEVLGAVKETLNARIHTKRSSRLTSIVADTLETLEEHVEEALGDEYEGDLSDLIEAEGLVDEEGEPILEDDIGTSTDDMTEGGDDTTEETNEEVTPAEDATDDTSDDTPEETETVTDGESSTTEEETVGE